MLRREHSQPVQSPERREGSHGPFFRLLSLPEIVAFWQDESYDHFVRDRAKFHRIQRYMESNPLGAGLAAAPESFPYSSASQGCRECRAWLKPRAD